MSREITLRQVLEAYAEAVFWMLLRGLATSDAAAKLLATAVEPGRLIAKVKSQGARTFRIVWCGDTYEVLVLTKECC